MLIFFIEILHFTPLPHHNECSKEINKIRYTTNTTAFSLSAIFVQSASHGSQRLRSQLVVLLKKTGSLPSKNVSSTLFVSMYNKVEVWAKLREIKEN